ncbi:MAG TPA: DUF1295 domain-containing protein [Prosthecobacter sp.]
MTLLLTAIFLLALFAAAWWLAVKVDNYSLVDVVWALSFAPVVAVYALADEGWGPRRAAIALLVGAWSLRLGIHLWRRVAGHHPKEDPRYGSLRKKWSGNMQRAFLWFFLAQGVLVWLLMLPVHLICMQRHQAFAPLEYVGLAVWFIALIGEGVADHQLARFKRANKDPNAICDVGLWHYSRHPNYFFQSLLWWGMFLMALPAPWGWTAVVAPLAMLHFLLNVTGVTLTEKLALEKRGEIYRRYQRTTSAFVPLPRKQAPSSHAQS